MKIPNQLPQFKKDSVLIIVTGKQDAALYYAENATIECIEKFKIPNPHYSDNEGHFKARSQGMTLSSGGTRERKDDEVINHFLHELKQRIGRIQDKTFQKVYILTPSTAKNHILRVLPQGYRQKISGIVEGNYYNLAPIQVIEKISVFETVPRRKASPQAEKILKKITS